MSNIKELIRQEIDRRMEELERDKYINIDAKACRHSELKFLERFIDSLPEEKPSEDLEKADELKNRIMRVCGYKKDHDQSLEEAALWNYYGGGYVPKNQELRDAALKTKEVQSFIAGAEWQKKQMKLDGIVTLTESDFDAEKEKASEWGYNLCKEQMLKDAVEGEKDTGWISVNDRLPETTEYVFTCVNQFGVPQCIGFHYYKDGKWWEGYGEDLVGAVEYWMPIPKFNKI